MCRGTRLSAIPIPGIKKKDRRLGRRSFLIGIAQSLVHQTLSGTGQCKLLAVFTAPARKCSHSLYRNRKAVVKNSLPEFRMRRPKQVGANGMEGALRPAHNSSTVFEDKNSLTEWWGKVRGMDACGEPSG
jgi:hypothetical protein